MAAAAREIQVRKFAGEVWNGKNYQAASEGGGGIPHLLTPPSGIARGETTSSADCRKRQIGGPKPGDCRGPQARP